MIMFVKKIFPFLFTLVVITSSFGQPAYDPSKKIASELLKQDVLLLKDSLQKLHAGLYRYKSKTEMEGLFQYTFSQLDRPMAETEYFSLISCLIGDIEDGHTECFLPQVIIEDLIANVKIFPAQLRFIGEKAYIPCDTKEFTAGTEIISIDNRHIDEIRKQLFRRLSSDGSIQTEKYVKINDGHDPFSYLYYVVYGEKPDFTVSYKTTSGQTGVKTLQASLFANMECPPVKAKIDKYLLLEYKPGNIAIMTIKTFANDYLNKTNEDLSTFLAASFKELNDKKTDKLIIDLRENGGGDDTNGALLYKYLTNKPFQFYSSLASTTKEVTDHPNLQLQQPKENNFKGKVYFLTSGKSFSGAAEFSSIAKTNSRGLFIGEETGGGYYGNTSGNKVAIILPNTKIRVNIPLYKYVMAVKKAKYKDRGIIPDYIIVPSITDYIQHKDVQLDYALKLAGEK
jgi:Peptidase family S41